MPKSKTKKYWYFTYISECVLCGHGDTYKERRFTKKPKDPNKRISVTEKACGEHFC